MSCYCVNSFDFRAGKIARALQHLLSIQTTKSWKILMNNQLKAQSLNRKSYRKFMLSYFSVTCYKHVELFWPISALDRKQVRGYTFSYINHHSPLSSGALFTNHIMCLQSKDKKKSFWPNFNIQKPIQPPLCLHASWVRSSWFKENRSLLFFARLQNIFQSNLHLPFKLPNFMWNATLEAPS